MWTVRQRVTDGIATIASLKHRATYGEYTQLFFEELDTSTCCFRGKEVWFEESDISDAVQRLEALFVSRPKSRFGAESLDSKCAL